MSKNQKKKADPKPEAPMKKKGEQMPLRWFRCPEELWAKVVAEAGDNHFSSAIIRDALEKRYQK